MSFRVSDEFIKGLMRFVAQKVKLGRLKRPYSFLSPKPFHFPRFSKLDRPWVAQPVKAEGLEMDALHDIYGMPRDIPQMFCTISGSEYGQEFADFTVEMFGPQVDTSQLQLNEVSRLAERSIGEKMVVSNADPDTLPLGGGQLLSMTNKETGEIVFSIAVWRWRVFMNDSSLCLENNWHTNDVTGGGWIPYILGIVYDNPEKMVADTIRFAAAFKLCNLVDASLSRPGRPERYQNKEEFIAALDWAALQLEADNAPITQPNVGALIEADERQIRFWCDKHEVDWSAWKRARAAKEDKR